MRPQTAAALLVLDRLYSEQLPIVAYEWLEAGLDSPTLRILAGERAPIMSEVGPMFYEVLQELEIPLPSLAEAVALLVSEVAQKIVDGTLSPFEGACEIDDLRVIYAAEADADYSRELWNLMFEYEELMYHQHGTGDEKDEEKQRQERNELEARMMAEARKLVV